MNSDNNVVFYKSRRKDVEKIQNIQAWIKIDKTGEWLIYFIDGKSENTVITGNDKCDINRIGLSCICELMDCIYNPNKKKNLTVHINNTFSINCVSEWMDKWKKNDFKIQNIDRPNVDLLKKIDVYKTSINITLKTLFLDNEEHLQFFK